MDRHISMFFVLALIAATVTKTSGSPASVFLRDHPYSSQTNGEYVITKAYLGYPVYQKKVGTTTWSLYRRKNGLWYLDFNGVDESYSGSVAYTNTPSNTPYGVGWKQGSCSSMATVSLRDTPYSDETSGEYAYVKTYRGYPVYQRPGTGRTYSLYRRKDGKWYFDNGALDETWAGTLGYTKTSAHEPNGVEWSKGASAI